MTGRWTHLGEAESDGRPTVCLRDAEDGVHGVCRQAVLPGRQVSGTKTSKTSPADTQPRRVSDWLIQPQLCFRCVWSRKGSTTTPSSRKWEHTRLPSPCSSRSWERSNTRAGRPCDVTVLSRCCHSVVTVLLFLSVCQTPGSSD